MRQRGTIEEIRKRSQVRGSRKILQNAQERKKGETMRTEEMKWGGDLEKDYRIQTQVGQNKASKSDMTHNICREEKSAHRRRRKGCERGRGGGAQRQRTWK